jgi:hypothetical protein
MLLKFNKFLVLLVLQFVLSFFYNISYAGRTVNINSPIPADTFIATNGTDSNNYSTPFRLDSNNNILNLNAASTATSVICGGTGQGYVDDIADPTNLLGNTSNNKLNINCDLSDTGHFLIGGITSTGTASSNTVNVYGTGEGTNLIFGGCAFCSGSAENNTINIYKDFSSESVYGGMVAIGTSSFNRVNVFSKLNIGTAGKESVIYGGNVYTYGIANNNSVYISGNIHSEENLAIYGGSVDAHGIANNNGVYISGSVESERDIKIIGGRAVDTEGNIVRISGKIASRGIITIVGGEAHTNVVNNKIIIYETAEIPENCALYGGLSLSGNTIFSGNSLEISFNKSSRIIGTISNFQSYKFILLEGPRSGDTILSFDNSNGLNSTFDVSDIDITILLPPNALNLGDTVLMHCDSGFTASTGYVSSSTLPGMYKGSAVECRSKFNLALSDNGKDVVATLLSKEVEARAEAKSYIEGVCGALAFVNQGGDIIAEKIMKEAWNNISSERLEAFGGVTYGNIKYKRGLNVEVKGIGVVAGVGKKKERQGAAYGVFCEYGNGDYRAQDKFGSVEVEGRGDNGYIGVGVLGRVEIGERLEERRGDGLYVEGSMRVGSSKVDYKTCDIEVTGAVERGEVKYNYNTGYVGVHICCGYGYKVSEKTKIEGSGRCKYTLQRGKEIELATKERVKFEEATSNRINIGVKGEYEVKGGIKTYIVLRGEQELNGEVKGKAEGKAIEGVKLEGLTGGGEVGMSMNISEKLMMEIIGECFVGKREGLSGMVKVKYAI